jgi:hypothetical protein
MANEPGVLTITETNHGTIKKVVAAWVSGNGTNEGTGTGTTTGTYSGRLIGATTVPGTGGVEPTVGYDVFVADGDGVDLALAGITNRHNTNTEYVAEASMAGVAHSKLTISIADTGDTKEGTLYLYLR